MTQSFSFLKATPNPEFQLRTNGLRSFQLSPIDAGIQIEISKQKWCFITGFQTASAKIESNAFIYFNPPIPNSDSTVVKYATEDYYLSKTKYLTIPLLVGFNFKEKSYTSKRGTTIYRHRIKLILGTTFGYNRNPFYLDTIWKSVHYYPNLESIGLYIINKSRSQYSISAHFRVDFLIGSKKPRLYISLTLNKGLIPLVESQIVTFSNNIYSTSTYRDFGDYANISIRIPIQLMSSIK